MIAIAAALLSVPAAPAQQQAAIKAYQDCLAPIVRANELAAGKDYQPLEVVLERIRAGCSTERAAAREALMDYVVANHSRPPHRPTDADKEELIHDATIRWASNVVHRMAAEADDQAEPPVVIQLRPGPAPSAQAPGRPPPIDVPHQAMPAFAAYTRCVGDQFRINMRSVHNREEARQAHAAAVGSCRAVRVAQLERAAKLQTDHRIFGSRARALAATRLAFDRFDREFNMEWQDK